MKNTSSNPQSPILNPQSGGTASPPRTAQGALAFDPATRMFSAKATTPPLKRATGGISEILLPHARSRWIGPRAAEMIPARIEQILRTALTSESPANEQALYDLMESTWPRLLKNITEVKEAVLGLDWNLMDADDGEAVIGAKQLIERARDGMKGDPCGDGHGWRSTLGALLDARARGISVSEIDWEYRGGAKFPGAWLPRQTRDAHPRFFGWKQDGALMFYPDGQPEKSIPFPPNKFLIAISKAGKGHPSGTALLRCLAWWWASMNFSQEWLLNFAQIFGQPFRWATYDASQEGVRDELAAMMEAMGSAAYGVGPDGTKVEWHESSKSGADNPQAYMLTLADTACDLLILGQTLTSSVGDSGSRALGEVHQSVRADIIDSAALWLAEILNEQLIPAVIAVNMGDLDEDERLPYFQPARKDKNDAKATAEMFKVIIEAGIPVLKEEVYEALDLSEPAEGDNVFGGVAASSGVSVAILTALSAAGLRVTDEGIRQLSESVQIGIERDPNAAAQAPPPGEIPADAAPMIRRVLAKLPLDAREYFMARLIDEKD